MFMTTMRDIWISFRIEKRAPIRSSVGPSDRKCLAKMSTYQTVPFKIYKFDVLLEFNCVGAILWGKYAKMDRHLCGRSHLRII